MTHNMTDLGDSRTSWIPLGISAVAAAINGLTYLGFSPADDRHNYLLFMFLFIPSMLITLVVMGRGAVLMYRQHTASSDLPGFFGPRLA